MDYRAILVRHSKPAKLYKRPSEEGSYVDGRWVPAETKCYEMRLALLPVSERMLRYDEHGRWSQQDMVATFPAVLRLRDGTEVLVQEHDEVEDLETGLRYSLEDFLRFGNVVRAKASLKAQR
jgi:hypothetical protein